MMEDIVNDELNDNNKKCNISQNNDMNEVEKT